MTATLYVRPATLDDAATMVEIYNEGIEDRIATFETHPRSVADIVGWFDDVYPIVVVIDVSGQVAGYAATFSYADRCC